MSRRADVTAAASAPSSVARPIDANHAPPIRDRADRAVEAAHELGDADPTLVTLLTAKLIDVDGEHQVVGVVGAISAQRRDVAGPTRNVSHGNAITNT